MKFGMYIVPPEPILAAYFIPISMCPFLSLLCKGSVKRIPPFTARQCLKKCISVATTEESMEEFSVWSESFQRKLGNHILSLFFHVHITNTENALTLMDRAGAKCEVSFSLWYY
jgi:hypothetical protein